MTAPGGQRCLVTGGGRGLGRAIALALARTGGRIALAARTVSELEETAVLARAEGGEAHVILADVSVRADAEHAVARAAQLLGGLDALVNDAAIQAPIGPLLTSDPHTWRQNVATTLYGTFYCCRAAVPHLVAAGGGAIVNLSGGGAAGPRPNFGAYAAAKAAVVRFTETLAMELSEQGITANAIAPGPMNTRMLAEILAAGELAGAEAVAAHRQARDGGTPPELPASLVAFLVSGRAGKLTGKLIAAPHDPWEEWTAGARADELNALPLYTLRRVDPHTVGPLLDRA